MKKNNIGKFLIFVKNCYKNRNIFLQECKKNGMNDYEW